MKLTCNQIVHKVQNTITESRVSLINRNEFICHRLSSKVITFQRKKKLTKDCTSVIEWPNPIRTAILYAKISLPVKSFPSITTRMLTISIKTAPIAKVTVLPIALDILFNVIRTMNPEPYCI